MQKIQTNISSILALFLRISFVVSIVFYYMNNPVNAQGVQGTHYCLSWSGYPSVGNVITAWDNASFSENRIIPYSEIEAMANSAKTVTDAQPVGRRTLHLNCGMGLGKNVLVANEQNHIWFDAGYTILKNNLERFIARFKAIGGMVDHTFVDIESGSQVWNLPGGGIPSTEVLTQIMNDPRYLTEVKPLLLERGFVPASPVELSNIAENSGEPVLKSLHIWNDVAAVRAANYMNQNIYEPLKVLYPDITFSTYEARLMSTDYPCPDMNGWTYYDFNLNGAIPGTHQSPTCYAWLWNNIIKNMPPGGLTEYPRTAFNGFRHSVNLVLSSTLAAPSVKVRPWITFKSYTDDVWGADKSVDGFPWIYAPVGKTYYYEENIFHLGLCNTDGFLGWVPDHMAPQSEYAYINELLKELDEVVGYADRKFIMTSVWDWEKDYLITGMYAGGHNVWRITPDTSKVSIADFKINDNPLTFKTGKATIVFTKGSKVITPRINNGKNGFWIKSPKGSSPAEDGEMLRIKK